ncbi:SRPBCC domain-containing protein [Microbacterium sp. RD1]|uniref:SRPBCC domain-containing protein n=1 Tax=Microbacterium sp. RD1 TaxID=3457313 RepID=UPI003FA52C0D
MVDVNAQVDAVGRSLGTEMVDGAECRVQSLTQTYPSPLDDVWEATTVGERIARWFAPVEGDLRVGGQYQVVGNAGGTVLSCTPPEDGAASYRVTWEFGGGVSWLSVALRARGDAATELTLTHIAPVAAAPPGFWEQYGPGATGVGWDAGLLGLALYLPGNSEVTPEQGEAWMLSDEGNAFVRRAADAWARAQIAAGGDAESAGRAADSTFAFYTGRELPST